MSLLERLAALQRSLLARRALALGLATLGALALAALLLALGARLGLLARARWLPLAWWLAVFTGVALVVRAIARAPSRAGAGLRDAARLVEAEQAMRRGTLVGLVDTAEGTPAGTSPALRERAARAVEEQLPERPQEWAPGSTAELVRRVRRRAVAGGAAALLAVAALWWAGDAAATLVSPVRALRAVVAAKVTLAASAAAVRPGATVTFTIRSTAPGRLALFLREPGEPWRRVAMDPGTVVEHRVTDLRAPLFAYAALDGASSDTLHVALIEPLLVAQLSVAARYPDYLNREAGELDPTAPLVVPTGTILTVRGAASAAISRAALVAADTLALRTRGSGFEGSLAVRGSAVWRLVLADRAGAEVPEPTLLDVRAVPDSAPVVAVPVPGADTTAPLDLRPVLVIDARDDYGLGRVEIVSWRVSRLGVVSDTAIDSVPGASGADRVVLTQVMDLTARGLVPGDTLRYFVRAADRAPPPHVGRSREYALRLRSLAELREAVRGGADSLAAQAAALAAEQAQVTRQTEDLAAQRNRTQDQTRTPPQAADARQARERQQGPGAMNFEQAAEAQRLADQQQQLAERAEQMREELERLARAAEDAGLNDREWQQQLRNLEDLMRQALTPELRARLEELQRALERLDPRAVQDALRRLTEEQRRLRDELQRSSELFERAAIEGSLQTFAQNAEALRRDQEQLNRRASQRQDTAQAAAEQQQLQQAADSLARDLQRLEERLRERGDSAAAAAVDSSGERVSDASQQMGQARQSMRAGQRSAAAQQGRRAAQQLEQVPQQLEETQQEMSEAWRNEVLRLLGQSLNETITLAAEEQRLARELRRGEGSAEARGRQSAAEQGVNQLVRQLQAAAGTNALVSPRLGAALGRAREQVAQSRQALEGPSPSSQEAAERAQEAAQLLSQAAFQMMRNRDDVAGAQSGSGFAEAVERMSQLAGQQGQLNDQLGGLLPMLGGGQEALMQQLRELAQRQRSLANQMERLTESGMPGRPDQLAEEARQLAERIESARLDRATLERQQRLFRRMLDAGRTLRDEEEPEDPERQSRTAGDVPGRDVRGRPPSDGAPRFPAPSWETLKGLSPSERAMVLDYFRRLNAPNR